MVTNTFSGSRIGARKCRTNETSKCNIATIFFEWTLSTDHFGVLWWKPKVCGGDGYKLKFEQKNNEKKRILTWLTAVKTIVNFWRWPSSDWVTSRTSNFLFVNFSHNLCNTCPSYRSSSMFLTIIRWSANSSLIQSIRIWSNSLTCGSSKDCGWMMARCSLSPNNVRALFSKF